VSVAVSDPTVALPFLVCVDQAFNQRLPPQRQIDALERINGGVAFSELIQTKTTQVTAFRALMRDYPDRDPASLWAHAYDVEVEIVAVDPTNGAGPKLSPPGAGTGG
jgi:hypothetical protein